jgi:hypothetical protein
MRAGIPIELFGPWEAKAFEEPRDVDPLLVACEGAVAQEAARVPPQLHLALSKLLAVVHHPHVVRNVWSVLGVVPDVLKQLGKQGSTAGSRSMIY